MSGYEMFQQVPLFMTTPMNLYYCARIDYGYVRDNKAHVIFTDREQRQWMFSLDLKKNTLPGTITRISNSNVFTVDHDYLMPEDTAYLHQTDRLSGLSQIEFIPMTKDTDDSLNCLYYHNRLDLNFVLPANFPFQSCKPSVKQCHNYRLAVIGGSPQRFISDLNPRIFTEIQSAYLDDCDIQNGYIRSFVLRDNPYVITGIKSSLFIATAIVYEDLNLNGHWDNLTEPILASMDGQILMFYSEPPSSAIYGESPDEKTYEIPVLSADQIQQNSGWHVYDAETILNKSDVNWHIIRHLTQSSANTLTLHSVKNAADGCYLIPSDESQPPCEGVLPMLIQ